MRDLSIAFPTSQTRVYTKSARRCCLPCSDVVITARFAFNQTENSSLRFLLAIVNAAQQECPRAFLSRCHSVRGPRENAAVVLCCTLDRASSPVTVCSYRRTVSGQRYCSLVERLESFAAPFAS
ncbi:hypothetical protein ALC53_08807 [Atta colombica]|uniref:Uncharacterized protein n=1 Tax=Atta colombica TaxID=520822 RepID=A0A195B7Y1_9HYME|nr:hypothetical protein ALC53_08807 [Atta colombica]